MSNDLSPDGGQGVDWFRLAQKIHSIVWNNIGLTAVQDHVRQWASERARALVAREKRNQERIDFLRQHGDFRWLSLLEKEDKQRSDTGSEFFWHTFDVNLEPLGFSEGEKVRDWVEKNQDQVRKCLGNQPRTGFKQKPIWCQVTFAVWLPPELSTVDDPPEPRLPLPLPDGPLSPAERWAALAAIHDTYWKGDKINPWPKPTEKHDLEAWKRWVSESAAYENVLRQVGHLKDADMPFLAALQAEAEAAQDERTTMGFPVPPPRP